jgi:DNA/RNA-binding domain of Phe-tRNA-synthetase-like protein
VVLRNGGPGETYEGIGTRTWHLEGRPVLADAEGPFGSPISDSTRTMITEGARDILAVIYAPRSAREASIEEAMKLLGERLKEFGKANATRTFLNS